MFLFLQLDIDQILSEAIRYLDYHPEFSTSSPGPEDPDLEMKRGFQELLTALLLNSALAAIKLASKINLLAAIELTKRAVRLGLEDGQRGRHPRPDTEITGNNNNTRQGILPSGTGPQRSQ